VVSAATAGDPHRRTGDAVASPVPAIAVAVSVRWLVRAWSPLGVKALRT
jgi:hypothetical protein